MTLRPRPPEPEGLNSEFYAQAAEGTLHLQQCRNCGQFRHPPRYLCARCYSPDYVWTASEGRGTLFSWTVTHFPFDRGWAEDLPYVTVVVELSEGIRLIGAYAGEAPANLALGMEMRAACDLTSHGFPFLTFREA